MSVVASVLLGALLSATLIQAPASNYGGHAVVTIYPKTDAEAAYGKAQAAEIWSDRTDGTAMDLRVSADGLAALRHSGIDFDIRIPDVGERAEVERERLAALPAPTYGTWFNDFRDFAEVDGFLDTLDSAAPQLTDVFTVGESLEGRTVRGIRIGDDAPNKASLLLTGTMHAREWLSPMTVSCIADRLVTGYGQDDEITDLLEVADIYMIPVLNPDGYVRSWQGERYWRKNTRNGSGVDLNRNWGYEWGGQGASTDPSAEDYRGSAAFSEPETQILRDFIDAQDHFVAHIDFHSYAELIIYPWGYGFDAAPDEALLQNLAGGMGSAISGVHGHSYQPIQGADFYPASGAIDDWAYGSAGLMSFTIELRGQDFVVSPSEIQPTCDENFAAVLDLLHWTAEQSDAMPGSGDTGDDGPDTGSDTDPGGGTGGDEGDGDAGTGSDADGDAGDGGSSDPDNDDAGSTPTDDDDDASVDEDDEADTSDPWLPGAYGMDQGEAGCALGRPAPTRAPWWLLLVLFVRRRRRHGTQ